MSAPKTSNDDAETVVYLLAAAAVQQAKNTQLAGKQVSPSLWDAFEEQLRSPLVEYLNIYDKDLLKVIKEIDLEFLSDEGRDMVHEHLKETEDIMRWDYPVSRYILSHILKDETRRARCLEMNGHETLALIHEKLNRTISSRESRLFGFAADVPAPAKAQDESEPETDPEHKECKELWKEIATTIKGIDTSLPPFVDMGLQRATTPAQREQLVDTLKDIKTMVGGNRSNSKSPVVGALLAQIDPGLVLPFARQPLISNIKGSRALMAKVASKIKELCPNRDQQIEELLLSIVRRMDNDQDALYPLMHGPPGTGKTYLVELLAEVFEECGVSVKSVIQSMSQNGGYSRENNEIAMALQGISPKWGDGQFGLLLKSCLRPTTSMCLTVLDEVDKCGLQDYLVSLLDPRQPLQDSFLREYIQSIDMRHKCLFFLTANNIEPLSTGANAALWSRLTPIEMPEYRRDEALELITKLAIRRMGSSVRRKKELQRDVEEVFAYYPQELPSIRTLINQVKRRHYQRQYSFLKGVPDGATIATTKRRAGFRP